MNEQVTEILKEAIDEINEQLNDNEKITFNKDTHFIGSKACIDSMGFVTLVSIIEELVADKTGKTIQLVNEKAFSHHNSPFYSVETLTQYIVQLLEESK